MGKNTGIQWCDDTVNPTSGCDGCELWTARPRDGVPPVRVCYAGHQHEGRLAVVQPKNYSRSFTEVRVVPGRMGAAAAASDLRGKVRRKKPWLDRRPRLIFVGDMGDMLSRAVPFEYLYDEVLSAALTEKGRRHVWLWLTKRPRRLAEFAVWAFQERGLDEWPANVWSGTSVTDRLTARRARTLVDLMPGKRFLSVEPLREPVDLTDVLEEVDWVLCGGASAQGITPAWPFDLSWARWLQIQCGGYHVPFFLKQLGSRPGHTSRVADAVVTHVRLDLMDDHGGDWDEWPEDLRVREVPEFSDVMVS